MIIYFDVGSNRERFCVSVGIVEGTNNNQIIIFPKYRYSKCSSVMEAVGLIKVLSLVDIEKEILLICDNKSIMDSINNTNKIKNERLLNRMKDLKSLLPEGSKAQHLTAEDSLQISLCDSLCNFIKKAHKNTPMVDKINNIQRYLIESRKFNVFKDYGISIV